MPYISPVDKIFIYARPYVNKMTWAFFLPGCRVAVLLSCSAVEETSKELPNFSIRVDLLGPDPTSSKNKAKKNSQVARFANLLEDQLQQILAERHSQGTYAKHEQILNFIDHKF